MHKAISVFSLVIDRKAGSSAFWRSSIDSMECAWHTDTFRLPRLLPLTFCLRLMFRRPKTDEVRCFEHCFTVRRGATSLPLACLG